MAKQKQQQQQQGAGLAGWHFIIIEENEIRAQGKILGQLGQRHLLQFFGPMSYSRLADEDSLESLTLFPDEQALGSFLEKWEENAKAAQGPAEEVVDGWPEGMANPDEDGEAENAGLTPEQIEALHEAALADLAGEDEPPPAA